MSSGNADFSALTKGKNLQKTGLYFRACGKDIICHCLAEMFYRLDPRYNPSVRGTTKSLEDLLLNLVSGALFIWPGDVTLNS